MIADPTFLTFFEYEASNLIKIDLDYFFDHDGWNQYKFSNAYNMKYLKFVYSSLITTRRHFNTVYSTSLVSEQLFFCQQTTKGFQFLIKKNCSLTIRRSLHVSHQGSWATTLVSVSHQAVEETKDDSPTNSSSTTSFMKVPNSHLDPIVTGNPDSPTIVLTPSGTYLIGN